MCKSSEGEPRTSPESMLTRGCAESPPDPLLDSPPDPPSEPPDPAEAPVADVDSVVATDVTSLPQPTTNVITNARNPKRIIKIYPGLHRLTIETRPGFGDRSSRSATHHSKRTVNSKAPFLATSMRWTSGTMRPQRADSPS